MSEESLMPELSLPKLTKAPIPVQTYTLQPGRALCERKSTA